MDRHQASFALRDFLLIRYEIFFLDFLTITPVINAKVVHKESDNLKSPDQ